MKLYYYYNGREQVGPYTLEELKSHNISRTTQIWHEGLTEWKAAADAIELQSLFITPPPFKPNISPSIVQTATYLESPVYKTGRSVGRYFWYILAIIIIIPIAILLYNQVDQQRSEKKRIDQAQQEQDYKKQIRERITSYVTAERSEYQYRQIGGIFNLKMTVTNNTDYLMDKVQVKIYYIKSDGSVWDNKLIDFNLVDAHTKLTIPIEDTERGISVKYEIVAIKSSALNL